MAAKLNVHKEGADFHIERYRVWDDPAISEFEEYYMKKHLSSEQGFTLIELLTIVAIIGLLSALGISSFSVYKSRGAYSVAQITVRNARNAAEASFNATENLPGAVPFTAQSSQGPISDPTVGAFLPGMQIPRNVKLRVQYDPTCTDGSCVEGFLQVNHCFAEDHVEWMRFGDGVDVLLDHVAGGGCS